jgi:hypothetical protein
MKLHSIHIPLLKVELDLEAVYFDTRLASVQLQYNATEEPMLHACILVYTINHNNGSPEPQPQCTET